MDETQKTPAVLAALAEAKKTYELATVARRHRHDAALEVIETTQWKRDPFYGYVSGRLDPEEMIYNLARQFGVNVNRLRDFRTRVVDPPVETEQDCNSGLGSAQPGQARQHSTIESKSYEDFKRWLVGIPDERVDLSWGRDSVLIKWAESVIGRDVDFDHDHTTCVETYAYYTVPGDPNGFEDTAYEVFHKDHWIHKLNMWLGRQEDNFDGDANWVPTTAAVKRIALLLG